MAAEVVSAVAALSRWGGVGCGGVRGSGRRACERADPLQRFDEVVEERVAGGEPQHEPAAGAADGRGDGDEAEAEPLGVALLLALREREQLQPDEHVVGEQGAEQVGPVGVEDSAGEVVEAEPELGFFDSVLDVGFGAVPALELVR